jgi:hypothetical protein
MTRLPLRSLFLAAGLFAVVAVAASASGQRVPLGPGPAGKSADDGDEPKAKKTAGKILTSESLSEMLDSMGYDFRAETLASGNVIYLVTIPSDTWKFMVEVSVAPNGSLVWLLAPLQQLPAAVPGEPLVRLLQENWTIYPQTFAIPKDGRRLYLQRAVENQNITPARLRAAIESMTGAIRNTAPLWDASKWGQTPTTDGKKDTGGAAAAYPDTAEGLGKLTKDLLAVAKSGKRADVAAKVKTLVLPNPEAWFRRVFGPEIGAALAEEYATGLAQTESGLARSLTTAIEEGQTQIKVFKFVKPGAENALPGQNKALQAMAVQTPLYSVHLTQPGEETGIHLYSFVYEGGTFRMAGKMKALTVSTTSLRPANGSESLIPAVAAAGKPRPDIGENGSQPEVNPILPPFGSPQLYQPFPLGFRVPAGPGAAAPANELDPENFRHLAPFLPPGVGPSLAPPAGQTAPKKKKQPPREDDEPSVVGTWVGEINLANQKWKVTSTFRANGTYTSHMEYLGHVIASRGTYTFADGILTTEAEGGVTTTFTVTFIDEDTAKIKGGGFTVTYRRQ